MEMSSFVTGHQQARLKKHRGIKPARITKLLLKTLCFIVKNMLLLIKFFILMYNNGKGVIHMKKAIFFLLLSIAIFSLFTSCPTSPPSPKEEPQRIEEAPVKEPEQPKLTEPVPEAEPKTVSVKKYTVVKGDILSRIALKHFGSLDRAYYFPIIMVMNEGIIKHPDKIRPGMTLNIPDFQEFMAHPE